MPKLYYDVLHSKDYKHCVISIFRNKEKGKNIKQDTITETKIVTITKAQDVKAISLTELALLRTQPKNNKTIISKGYKLVSENKKNDVYISSLNDSIIVTYRFQKNENKIDWIGGTNRQWLFNYLQSTMKATLRFHADFSNNDESDREVGIPYFIDESYFDKKGIHYKSYTIFIDEKIISYMVTIRPFIGGYIP